MGSQSETGGETVPLADYQRLVRAAAEALALAEAMGWRDATKSDRLETDDDRRDARLAEAAYHNLQQALPIPARFAAEFVFDARTIEKREDDGASLPGLRARRWWVGESAGETFGEDDDFHGLVLTVELSDANEARMVAQAFMDGMTS